MPSLLVRLLCPLHRHDIVRIENDVIGREKHVSGMQCIINAHCASCVIQAVLHEHNSILCLIMRSTVTISCTKTSRIYMMRDETRR